MIARKVFLSLICCVFVSNSYSQCTGLQIVANKTSACVPDIVQFQVLNSVAGSTYQWDVGNGPVSGVDTIYSYYSSPQVIDASVTITLPSGSTCVVTETGIVKMNEIPVPEFKVSRKVLCDGPDSILLTDVTPMSQNRSWVVDGTNHSNTLSSTQHNFVTPGKKSFSMVVTDSNGCKGVKQFEDQVIVYAKPNFTLKANINGGCVPKDVEIQIDNNPDIQDFTKTYDWKFSGIDDSTFIGLKPDTLTFVDAGSYDVGLNVTVTNGCVYNIVEKDFLTLGDTTPLNLIAASGPTCEFDTVYLQQANSPLPGTINWTFDGVPLEVFDEDNYQAKVVCSDIGSLNVKMVYDYNGCVSTSVTNPYTEIIGVRANFGSDDHFHCQVPHTVHLDNKTDSMDASSVTYQWTILDGSKPFYTSTDPDPEFTFTKMPGNFGVELIAVGDNGCRDTMVRHSYIYQDSLRLDFDIAPKVICIDQVMTVLNETRPSTYVAPDEFKWYFYDVNDVDILDSSELRSPTFSYDSVGFYDLAVIGQNDAGCRDTLRLEDIVEVVKPELEYSLADTIVCKGGRIGVKGLTTPVHANFNHSWRFERLNSASFYEAKGEDTYITPYVLGEYRGIYSHDIAGGCLVKDTTPVYVNGLVANINLDTTYGCAGLVIQPTSTVVQDYHHGFDGEIYQYRWYAYPANGVTIKNDSTSNPEFTFAQDGDFYIKLEITNSAGCTYLSTSSKVLIGVRAGFSIDDNIICLGDDLNVNDQSYNGVSNVSWSLLDNSTLVQTSKIDKKYGFNVDRPGDFSIQQIVTNKNICFDTISRSFEIIEVIAQFTAVDSFLQCAPVFAEFQSTSLRADTLIWDFGQGELFKTISSSAGTIYLKNSGWEKGYDISLVAKNNEGCYDTLLRENYLVVAGPLPFFEMENFVGCEPLAVTFIDKSIDESYAYMNYNDGSTLDSSKNGAIFGPHTYTVQTANVLEEVIHPSIIVYDSLGCTAIFEPEDSIVIYRSPVTNTSYPNGTSFCEYNNVLFTDSGSYTDSRVWKLDGVEKSQKQLDSLEGLTVGKHDLTLVSSNSHFCVDSFTTDLEVHARPLVSFEIKDTICKFQPEEYIGNIQSVTELRSFRWNFGESGSAGNINSKDINPQFTYQTPGNKTIQLFASVDNGCEDSVTQQILITDETSIDTPPILYASYLENDLVFLRFDSSKIDRFKNYIINNGTDEHRIDVQDSLSIEIQYLVEPKGANCFNIQVEDYCDFVGSLSEEHCLIDLDVSSNVAYVNQLDWSPYIGWDSVMIYEIYRKDDNDVFVKIGKVDGEMTSFLDSGLCDEDYEYYVQALHHNQKYISRSQSRIYRPQYDRNPFRTSITNVTVSSEDEIKVTWKESQFSEFDSYKLLKYENDFNTLVDEIVLDETEYIDTDVETDHISYIYQIVEQDRCGYFNEPEREGKSILLEGTYLDGSILDWSSYQNWKDGVQKYVIELDFNGEYKPTNEVAGSITTFKDEKIYRSIKGQYNYRICAFSNDNDTSFSNVINIFGDPTVHIPTAFTPNGDGLNDGFNPVTMFVQSKNFGDVDIFKLEIFNRWGEKVYSSRNPQAGWNGTYKGEDCEQGAYIYQVMLTGVNGRKIYKNGTITLLR